MSRAPISRSVSEAYARLDASWRDRWTGVCRRCEYPVRGLPGPSPRCPECGDAIDAKRDLWEDGRHTLGVATAISTMVGFAIAMSWIAALRYCVWSITNLGGRPRGLELAVPLVVLMLASLAGLVIVMRTATLHTRDLRHAVWRWVICATACLLASWLLWFAGAGVQIEMLLAP